jgi:GGDEF domain-containing protein
MGAIDFSNDGQRDFLTGLMAPEPFYRYLQQELAFSKRYPEMKVGAIKIVASALSAKADKEQRLVELAHFLKKATRADEIATRIGEYTFISLVRIKIGNPDMNPEIALSSIEERLRAALSIEALSEKGFDGEKKILPVEISGYIHRENENFLEFLERVEV